MAKGKIKRNSKDSVFCDLFREPEYQLLLYLTLHPEDTDVTVEDMHTVTISNIFVNDLYNDLGFIVRGRLVVLVEAQSTWSINIIIRVVLYLAETWKRHIKNSGQSPYGSKKLDMPKPEFYVIYTGHDKPDVNEWYSLADEFFNGDRSFLDAHVKILRGSEDSKDIVSQYVTFTRVLDEQIRLFGPERKAVEETIRICRNEDVLAEYLSRKETEVMDMVDVLRDVDWNLKILNKQAVDDARAEGKAEGEAKGKSEQKAEDDKKHDDAMLAAILGVMSSMNSTADKAMDVMNMTDEQKSRYSALMSETSDA